MKQKLKAMSRHFTERTNGSTLYKKMFNLTYNQKNAHKNYTEIRAFTNRFGNYRKKNVVMHWWQCGGFGEPELSCVVPE